MRRSLPEIKPSQGVWGQKVQSAERGRFEQTLGQNNACFVRDDSSHLGSDSMTGISFARWLDLQGGIG